MKKLLGDNLDIIERLHHTNPILLNKIYKTQWLLDLDISNIYNISGEYSESLFDLFNDLAIKFKINQISRNKREIFRTGVFFDYYDTVKYSLDSDNVLTKEKRVTNSCEIFKCIVNEFDLITSENIINPINGEITRTINYYYDDNNMVTNIIHIHDGNMKHTFNYDYNEGKLSRINHNGCVTFEYFYDEIGRLVKANCNGFPYTHKTTLNYKYNESGLIGNDYGNKPFSINGILINFKK